MLSILKKTFKKKGETAQKQKPELVVIVFCLLFIGLFVSGFFFDFMRIIVMLMGIGGTIFSIKDNDYDYWYDKWIDFISIPVFFIGIFSWPVGYVILSLMILAFAIVFISAYRE